MKKKSYLNDYLKKLFCQACCFSFPFNQDGFSQAYFFNFQSVKILSDFWLDILNLKNIKHLKKN